MSDSSDMAGCLTPVDGKHENPAFPCDRLDHDHNQIHTRVQLTPYDPELSQLCADVLGESAWRFVSPRTRAGTAHLAGYDPASAPKMVKLECIEQAAQDYHDTYWKDYWQRLHDKYPAKVEAKPAP